MLALHRSLAFSAAVAGFEAGPDPGVEVFFTDRPVHTRFSFLSDRFNGSWGAALQAFAAEAAVLEGLGV